MKTWIKLWMVLLGLTMGFGLGAQEAPPKRAQINVHVLDSDGDSVEGAEVILEIIKADNSKDRRLAETNAEGVAGFEDIQMNCLEIQATVRLDTGDIKGKPRSCDASPEVFVVVPAPPAPVEEPSAPVEEPPAPVEEPIEPEEEIEIIEPTVPFYTTKLLEASGRFGVDFCIDTPNKKSTCKDAKPGIALQGNFDVQFISYRKLELSLGLLAGYRMYSTEAANSTAPPEYDPIEGESVNGPTAETSGSSTRNHLLTFGSQLKASLVFNRFRLSFEAISVGVSAHIFTAEISSSDPTTPDYTFSDTNANLFIKSGLSGAFYIVRNTYIGIYAELFQPLPDATAALSTGVVMGGHFGPGHSVFH